MTDMGRKIGITSFKSGLVRMNYRLNETKEPEPVQKNSVMVLVNGFRPRGEVREIIMPSQISFKDERIAGTFSTMEYIQPPPVPPQLCAAFAANSYRSNQPNSGPPSPQLGAEAPEQSPVRPVHSEDEGDSGQFPITKKKEAARAARKSSEADVPPTVVDVAEEPEQQHKNASEPEISDEEWDTRKRRGRRRKVKKQKDSPVPDLEDITPKTKGRRSKTREVVDDEDSATNHELDDTPRKSKHISKTREVDPDYQPITASSSSESDVVRRKRGRPRKHVAEAVTPEAPSEVEPIRKGRKSKGRKCKALLVNEEASFDEPDPPVDEWRSRFGNESDSTEAVTPEAPSDVVRKGRKSKGRKSKPLLVNEEASFDEPDPPVDDWRSRLSSELDSAEAGYHQSDVPKKRVRKPKNRKSKDVLADDEASIEEPDPPVDDWRSRLSSELDSAEAGYHQSDVPKKRGRKPKNRKSKDVLADDEASIEEPDPPVDDWRSRLSNELDSAEAGYHQSDVPKKRGRKPKNRKSRDVLADDEDSLEESDPPVDYCGLGLCNESDLAGGVLPSAKNNDFLACESTPEDLHTSKEVVALVVEPISDDEDHSTSMALVPFSNSLKVVPGQDDDQLAIEAAPPTEPTVENKEMAVVPFSDSVAVVVEENSPPVKKDDDPEEASTEKEPRAIEPAPPTEPKLTVHPCLKKGRKGLNAAKMRLTVPTSIPRPISGTTLCIMDSIKDNLSIAEKIKVRPRVRRPVKPVQIQDEDEEEDLNNKVRKKKKPTKKPDVKEKVASKVVHSAPPVPIVEPTVAKVDERVASRLSEERTLEDPFEAENSNSSEYVPKRRKKKSNSVPVPVAWVNNSFPPQYGSAYKRKNQFPRKTCPPDPEESTVSKFLRSCFNVPLINDQLAMARWYKQRLKTDAELPVMSKENVTSNRIDDPISKNEEQKSCDGQQTPVNEDTNHSVIADVRRCDVIRITTPHTDHLYAQPHVVLRKSDRCDSGSLTIQTAIDQSGQQDNENPSQLLLQKEAEGVQNPTVEAEGVQNPTVETEHGSAMDYVDAECCEEPMVEAEEQIVETDVHNLDIQQQVSIEEDEPERNTSTGEPSEKELFYTDCTFGTAPYNPEMQSLGPETETKTYRGTAALSGQLPQESALDLDPAFIDADEVDPLEIQLNGLLNEPRPMPAPHYPQQLPIELQDHIIDMVPVEPNENDAVRNDESHQIGQKRKKEKPSPKKNRSSKKIPKDSHDIDLSKHTGKGRTIKAKKQPKDYDDNVKGPDTPRKLERSSSLGCRPSPKTETTASADGSKLRLRLMTPWEVPKFNGHEVKKVYTNSKRERQQSEMEKSKSAGPPTKKRILDVNIPENKRNVLCARPLFSPLDKNKTNVIVQMVNLFGSETYKGKKKPQAPKRVRQVVRSEYAPPDSAEVAVVRKIRR